MAEITLFTPDVPDGGGSEASGRPVVASKLTAGVDRVMRTLSVRRRRGVVESAKTEARERVALEEMALSIGANDVDSEAGSGSEEDKDGDWDHGQAHSVRSGGSSNGGESLAESSAMASVVRGGATQQGRGESAASLLTSSTGISLPSLDGEAAVEGGGSLPALMAGIAAQRHRVEETLGGVEARAELKAASLARLTRLHQEVGQHLNKAIVERGEVLRAQGALATQQSHVAERAARETRLTSSLVEDTTSTLQRHETRLAATEERLQQVLNKQSVLGYLHPRYVVYAARLLASRLAGGGKQLLSYLPFQLVATRDLELLREKEDAHRLLARASAFDVVRESGDIFVDSAVDTPPRAEEAQETPSSWSV